MEILWVVRGMMSMIIKKGGIGLSSNRRSGINLKMGRIARRIMNMVIKMRRIRGREISCFIKMRGIRSREIIYFVKIVSRRNGRSTSN